MHGAQFQSGRLADAGIRELAIYGNQVRIDLGFISRIGKEIK